MGKWNNDYGYHHDSWSVNKNNWKKSSSFRQDRDGRSSWHKSRSSGDDRRSYWRNDFSNDNDSVSKWLTYVLRHGASEAREELDMDKHGFVSVDQLIALREKESGKTTSLAKAVQDLSQIRWVVKTCPKQRFEIWEARRLGSLPAHGAWSHASV
eukprot:Skav200393  [mRNA]  locus=scaffold4049:30767:32142:+ [translate_table: standard]